MSEPKAGTRPSAPATPGPARVSRRFRPILFATLAIVLGLALAEGLASLGLFAYDVAVNARAPVAERQHTIYDAELGWVNRPSTHLQGLYGRGRSLTINSQGFRATADYPVEVPPGRLRILVSGDSFTLGYGVDDAQTWCAALERRDSRYQIVNMGQGGYGLDQMYLWYMRDGGRLHHQIHLFAPVNYDFPRMTSDRFLGYGKPILELQGDTLVAGSVPVPRRAYFVPWLTQNAELIQKLRLTELLTRATGLLSRPEAKTLSYDQVATLAFKAMENMAAIDASRGSQLVYVWLPVASEHQPMESDPSRIAWIAALRNAGFIAIDLVDELRAVPSADVDALFISDEEAAGFPGAAGHYSARGNAFIARLVDQKLRRIPELGHLYR